MRQLRHLLLPLLAVLPLCVAAPASAQHTIATDKAALVALYNATDGATNWTTRTNWTSDMALDSWHGVITWGYLRGWDPELSVEERSIAISEVDSAGTEVLQVKAWASSKARTRARPGLIWKSGALRR